MNTELKCIFKAHITLKDDVAPIFHKPRPVPYSLREKVDKELDKQVEAGILKKVERSEWASPVVIVPKPDGSVRIIIMQRLQGINQQGCRGHALSSTHR